MKIIAVDHGNAQVKTCHRVFTSGLKVHQKLPSNGEYVKWNGKYYTLTNDRIPYQEDKTQSVEFFVLTLFAIGKELVYSRDYEKDMDIALSVGLPPEHMFDQDKMKAWGLYFTKEGRKVDFEYNGKTYTVNIRKVNVAPQGYSIVFLNRKMFEDLSKAYIVDIGGYTIDVLTLHNAKMDNSLIRSLDMGIITYYNKAINQVKTDTGIRIDEDIINDFLKTGKSPRADVTESLTIAFDEYCRSVVNKLSELGIDLRIHNVTFVGGGSTFLKNNLQKASEDSKSIHFISDIKANALGYHAIMAAKLKRG